MKRKLEASMSCEFPPCKKRKISDYNVMDDVENGLLQLNVSEEIEENDEEKKECADSDSDDRNNEWEVFCSNKLETNLLSSLEEGRGKKFMGDIVIYESQFYEYKDLVICRGKNTTKIKDTLKKIGFKWNAKKYEWTMNKKWFVADFYLFIHDLLRKECEEKKLALQIFDIHYQQKRKSIMISNIDTFITYNKKMNEIQIKTSIDEQEMIELLNKYHYGFSHYKGNEMNIYKKQGKLYDGHIKTWKEYAIINEWILGFNPNNIEPTPYCITCNAKLVLHKVQKPGDNNGRKFYNCDQCYYVRKDYKKRNASFVWADGHIEKDKVSELVIDQQLTQPLSQIIL